MRGTDDVSSGLGALCGGDRWASPRRTIAVLAPALALDGVDVGLIVRRARRVQSEGLRVRGERNQHDERHARSRRRVKSNAKIKFGYKCKAKKQKFKINIQTVGYE